MKITREFVRDGKTVAVTAEFPMRSSLAMSRPMVSCVSLARKCPTRLSPS